MNYMKEYAVLTRAGEWIDSKLSFFMACAGLLILSTHSAPGPRDLLFLLANAVFFASYLGCSYLINDIADRDVDLRAGKKKLVTQIPLRKLAAVFVLTMLAGIVFVALAEIVLGRFQPYHLLVLCAVYYLGFSYSVKPLRFKEKGLAGTVFCSCAQRILPLIMTVLVYRPDPALTVILVLLNFFVGMRYILIHQLMDRANDIRTGVKTFSTEHPVFSRSLVYGNLAAEGVLIVLLNVLVFLRGQFVPGGALLAVNVFYACLLVLYVRAVRYMLNEDVFETFSFVPFEDYYNFFLPLWFFLCFAKSSPWLLAFAALVVLAQIRMVRVRGEFLSLYLKKALLKKAALKGDR